jgi:magnesium-protoporphyrin O-methyltransferase
MWIFGERTAHMQARRYRRRGLDGVSKRIVDFVKGRGIRGRTVLEVGAGIGDIEIELLKAGADHAVGVELIPTYEDTAGELLREAGLEGRVDRKVLDFAAEGSAIEGADVVVLNRVICCYPDMPLLAGEAADHTRTLLVLTFPNGRWWTRLGVALANVGLAVMRRQFHVFVHPPARIAATVEGRGFRTAISRPGIFWQLAAFERAG